MAEGFSLFYSGLIYLLVNGAFSNVKHYLDVYMNFKILLVKMPEVLWWTRMQLPFLLALTVHIS